MTSAATIDAHGHGEVIAGHGRQYLVRLDDGSLVQVVPRGKRSELACGDRIAVTSTSRDQAVVDSMLPRATLFARAAAHRTKLIAANATQVAVVTATEPSWGAEIVARVIVAAECAGLKAMIVFNKCDLPPDDEIEARLADFVRAGYPVVRIAAKIDVTPLAERLRGERTVLIGQSGMGKSTIVNALVPDAQARTGEISRFLDSGRHTTSSARLYRVDDRTELIDSPGLQEFGLAHLTRAEIESGFVEIRPLLGRCRFNDCRHDAEPDCALKNAVATGRWSPRRFELMMRILAAERR